MALANDKSKTVTFRASHVNNVRIRAATTHTHTYKQEATEESGGRFYLFSTNFQTVNIASVL